MKRKLSIDDNFPSKRLITSIDSDIISKFPIDLLHFFVNNYFDFYPDILPNFVLVSKSWSHMACTHLVSRFRTFILSSWLELDPWFGTNRKKRGLKFIVDYLMQSGLSFEKFVISCPDDDDYVEGELIELLINSKLFQGCVEFGALSNISDKSLGELFNQCSTTLKVARISLSWVKKLTILESLEELHILKLDNEDISYEKDQENEEQENQDQENKEEKKDEESENDDGTDENIVNNPTYTIKFPHLPSLKLYDGPCYFYSLCPKAPKLETVVSIDNFAMVTRKQICSLKKCTNLSKLVIGDRYLDEDDALLEVANLSNLKELSIQGYFHDEALEAICNGCTQLELFSKSNESDIEDVMIQKLVPKLKSYFGNFSYGFTKDACKNLECLLLSPLVPIHRMLEDFPKIKRLCMKLLKDNASFSIPEDRLERENCVKKIAALFEGEPKVEKKKEYLFILSDGDSKWEIRFIHSDYDYLYIDLAKEGTEELPYYAKHFFEEY